MFFLYFILGLFVISIILTVFLSFEIQIKNIKFSTEKINNRYINNDFKVIIKFYLFEKIKIFSINITKSRIERNIAKLDVEKLQKNVLNNKNDFDIRLLKVLKNLKIKLNKINVQMEIGLKDAMKLALTTGGISSVLGIVFGFLKTSKNEIYWNIQPIYQNRNFLKVTFQGIFKVKMIHIIYTIYVELYRKKRLKDDFSVQNKCANATKY